MWGTFRCIDGQTSTITRSLCYNLTLALHLQDTKNIDEHVYIVHASRQNCKQCLHTRTYTCMYVHLLISIYQNLPECQNLPSDIPHPVQRHVYTYKKTFLAQFIDMHVPNEFIIEGGRHYCWYARPSSHLASSSKIPVAIRREALRSIKHLVDVSCLHHWHSVENRIQQHLCRWSKII